MADAPAQTAPPDLAAQEEMRRQLMRERTADAGMLNVPFLGNKALQLANQDRLEFGDASNPVGQVEEARRERGFRAGWRQAFSAAQAEARAAKESGETGSTEATIKKQLGGAIIKMSWSTLWLSFGHTIYIIDILFFAGWASKYLRQYIPEVGTEWFPPQVLKKMPASALLPLKLGEIVGMAFITFWVLLMDLLILGCIAFVVGLIMSVKNAV